MRTQEWVELALIAALVIAVYLFATTLLGTQLTIGRLTLYLSALLLGQSLVRDLYLITQKSEARGEPAPLILHRINHWGAWHRRGRSVDAAADGWCGDVVTGRLDSCSTRDVIGRILYQRLRIRLEAVAHRKRPRPYEHRLQMVTRPPRSAMTFPDPPPKAHRSHVTA